MDGRIPLSAIKPHPSQPRRDMALTAGFLASVQRHGILVPIVLHHSTDAHGNPGGASYVVGEGHRRVAALRALGREQLDADEYVLRSRDGDEDLVMRVANAMRRPLRPFEWAEVYQMDADDGATHAEIAQTYDVSRGRIGQYLALRWALEPPVREAVLDGRLKFAHARALCRLSDRENPRHDRALRKRQLALLQRCRDAGWGVSSRQVEAWVEEELGCGRRVGQGGHAQSQPDPADVLRHVEEAKRLVCQLAHANGCGDALLRELAAIEKAVLRRFGQ